MIGKMDVIWPEMQLALDGAEISPGDFCSKSHSVAHFRAENCLELFPSTKQGKVERVSEKDWLQAVMRWASDESPSSNTGVKSQIALANLGGEECPF
jgi:hypothetical protein